MELKQQQSIPRTSSNLIKWAMLLVPPFAVVVAILSSRKPLLGIMAALAIPFGYALIVWPEAATLATIFILYTNSADIAVTFHGLPYFVGVSFILLLTIPLAFYIVIRREKIVVAPALPILVLFALAEFISAVLAPYPDKAFREVVKFSAESIGLFILVTNVVRTPETLRRVCWTLLAAGILMSVIPIYQYATDTYDNDYGGYAQSSGGLFEVEKKGELVVQRRLTGPIGEQNRYAQVMLMLVPIGIFLGASEKRYAARMLAWGISALVTVGMSLAFSRGAAVGAVVLVMFMAWMRYITKTHLVCIAAGIAVLMIAMPDYAERIGRLQGLWAIVSPNSASPGNEPDFALKNRTVEMLAAVHMFMDHPLTGVGPGMFPRHYPEYSRRVGDVAASGGREAHNLVLGLAAESGLFGLVTFGMIIFVTLRDLLRTRNRLLYSDPRSAFIATGFFLTIISYLVTGMALHFAFVRYFWLMMALGACASLVVAREPEFVQPAQEQA